MREKETLCQQLSFKQSSLEKYIIYTIKCVYIYGNICGIWVVVHKNSFIIFAAFLSALNYLKIKI